MNDDEVSLMLDRQAIAVFVFPTRCKGIYNAKIKSLNAVFPRFSNMVDRKAFVFASRQLLL
jgi:hypothetical protein